MAVIYKGNRNPVTAKFRVNGMNEMRWVKHDGSAATQAIVWSKGDMTPPSSISQIRFYSSTVDVYARGLTLTDYEHHVEQNSVTGIYTRVETATYSSSSGSASYQWKRYSYLGQVRSDRSMSSIGYPEGSYYGWSVSGLPSGLSSYSSIHIHPTRNVNLDIRSDIVNGNGRPSYVSDAEWAAICSAYPIVNQDFNIRTVVLKDGVCSPYLEPVGYWSSSYPYTAGVSAVYGYLSQASYTVTNQPSTVYVIKRTVLG